MAPASSPSELLKSALQDFRHRLHDKLPLTLKHCIEFVDEARIKEVAAEEKIQVWQQFTQKLSKLENPDQDGDRAGDSVNQFSPGIEKAIREFIAQHNGYRTQVEGLMKKRIDHLCLDLKTSIEEKLLLTPEMDMKSLEKILGNGKFLAVKHFENWKHGNLVFYEEQLENLKEQLDLLDEEIRRKFRSDRGKSLLKKYNGLAGMPEIRLSPVDAEINGSECEAPKLSKAVNDNRENGHDDSKLEQDQHVTPGDEATSSSKRTRATDSKSCNSSSKQRRRR